MMIDIDEDMQEINIGDRVIIDGDRSIIGVVTAVLIRPSARQIEVGWFAAGVHQSVWFDNWRLTKLEDPKDS